MTHSDGRVHHEWVSEMSDYLHEACRLVRSYTKRPVSAPGDILPGNLIL